MNGERTGKCLRQVVNIYTQYMKTFSPCPRPGPGLSYVVVFCVFNDLRRDVFVRFVDFGGAMDYYPLSFLFANIYALKALDAHRNMLCIVICNSWVLQYRERISIEEKKAFEYFPIGSNVNLCIAVAAILDFRSA